jgi:hypothetical protein
MGESSNKPQKTELNQILEEATERLTRLSPERLRMGNDSLISLEELESWEATEELLATPGLEEAHQSAAAEAAENRLVRLEKEYSTTLEALEQEGLPDYADHQMHEDYIMWHHWAEVAEKPKRQPTDRAPNHAEDTHSDL